MRERERERERVRRGGLEGERLDDGKHQTMTRS